MQQPLCAPAPALLTQASSPAGSPLQRATRHTVAAQGHSGASRVELKKAYTELCASLQAASHAGTFFTPNSLARLPQGPPLPQLPQRPPAGSSRKHTPAQKGCWGWGGSPAWAGRPAQPRAGVATHSSLGGLHSTVQVQRTHHALHTQHSAPCAALTLGVRSSTACKAPPKAQRAQRAQRCAHLWHAEHVDLVGADDESNGLQIDDQRLLPATKLEGRAFSWQSTASPAASLCGASLAQTSCTPTHCSYHPKAPQLPPRGLPAGTAVPHTLTGSAGWRGRAWAPRGPGSAGHDTSHSGPPPGGACPPMVRKN